MTSRGIIRRKSEGAQDLVNVCMKTNCGEIARSTCSNKTLLEQHAGLHTLGTGLPATLTIQHYHLTLMSVETL